MVEVGGTVVVEVVEKLDGALGARCRELAERALPPLERDDRFDGPADPATPFVAALATVVEPDRVLPCGDGPAAGPLAAYLGGRLDAGRLSLDALVDAGATAGTTPAGLLAELLDAVLDHLAGREIAAPTDTIEVWGRPARPWHEELAASEGLTPVRALHQMRCPLPVAIEPLPTRDFDPVDDLDQLREVNNRAFADHPDQGGRTVADLTAVMAQPWFRPEGLRVLEQAGRIVGFCWTKIHPATPGGEALGEIYVIGIDPDLHGRGMGAPLTAAGLAWLHGQGLGTGMLYVEADNAPAVATYRRLGFEVVRTDRSWVRTFEATEAGR